MIAFKTQPRRYAGPSAPRSQSRITEAEIASAHRTARAIAWVIAPLWLVIVFAFFVWAPSLPLHRQVTRRDIVPGAIFTLLGLVATRVLSSYVFVNWLEWYGKYYGGLGIVLALFFWVTIPATSLVLAAALSPAFAHRRDLRQVGRAGPV